MKKCAECGAPADYWDRLENLVAVADDAQRNATAKDERIAQLLEDNKKLTEQLRLWEKTFM